MFQTPELLIQNMLRPMLALLPAADLLDDNELRLKLIAMARRLNLADTLLRQWTITIGGAQGVGKTTLIRQLYSPQHDLDEWLPDSGGRDETMPVLILEDDNVTEPKGFLRMAHSLGYAKEEPAEAETFKSATKGQVTDCLLPVLRLPPACLAQTGDALLLLPGYETEHDENSEWQVLLRQAMAGAHACVVVTDDQRMAEDVGLTILKDMRHAEVEPIVVISGTESMDPAKRSELRASAADMFKVRAEAVVCTGLGAAYREEWAPRLITEIRAARSSPARVRKMQLMYLQSLLRELNDLLNEVRVGLTLHNSTAVQESTQAKLLLGVFDEAVKRLRASYRRMLDVRLNAHFKEAAVKLEDRLIKNHQGWMNGFRGAFIDTVGESQRRLRQDIEAAWVEPGDCGDLNAAVLAQVTFKALGGPLEELVQLTPQTDLQQRLGYSDAKGSAVQWSGGGESTMRALRYLLRNEDELPVTKDEFNRAVRELPALALEFCRFVQLMPEKLRVDANTGGPVADTIAAIRQASEHFNALAKIQSDVIKTIGMVLGVDKAAEEVSSLPALFKALGLSGEAAGAAGDSKLATAKAAKPAQTKAPKDDKAAAAKKTIEAVVPIATTAAGAGAETAVATLGLGTTLATGAAALAAAGLIYMGINMVIRSADKDKSDFAQRVLAGIRDAHLIHYMKHFDEIMLTVRGYFEERLQIRYGLTPDLLRSDRLARALAELKALHSEMQDALNPRLLIYTA
jgi:hypothetical protein